MASLRIAEIFASIQGEGRWMGTPSTFVRVSGCNLRCRWCDTPYASWNPEGPTLAVDEILAQVASHGLRHVVVTGGEPMLFDAVEPLAHGLAQRGHTITIETAGTVYRELPCHLMSISPKLANSTPEPETGWAERHERTRDCAETVLRLMGAYDYQLKFVVDPEGSPRDVAEVEGLVSRLGEVPPEKVMLMPEGVDAATLRRRMAMLAPICMERGWRLALRLHVELFGNVRGT